MSRLTSASIRFILKKSRANRNGEYPIYLVVCFSGRVEKTTGISCSIKLWDADREMIRKNHPNAPILNKMLSDIKQRVNDKKLFYELNGQPYTPSMLVEESVNDYSGKSNRWIDLQRQYLNEKHLSKGTEKLYEFCYKKLSDYIGRNDFLVNEVNVKFLKDFINHSLENGCNSNTCKGLLNRIGAIWNYAILKGMVPNSDYPIKDFKFGKKLEDIHRNYYLDAVTAKKLKQYFLDLVIVQNGGLYRYVDGADERLFKRTSKEFAICFFLSMILLNGSAPIDVAKLKTTNCSMVSVNGVDYWKVVSQRSKTGVKIECLLKKDDIFNKIIFEHFLGTAHLRGGYIYPILNPSNTGEMQIKGAVHKVSDKAVYWLREVFKEINAATIKNNVENNLNEPLVEVNKITMYVARHTFANLYLSRPNASIHGLASLMARSPNRIATYIHQLQADEELVNATSGLLLV